MVEESNHFRSDCVVVGIDLLQDARTDGGWDVLKWGAFSWRLERPLTWSIVPKGCSPNHRTRWRRVSASAAFFKVLAKKSLSPSVAVTMHFTTSARRRRRSSSSCLSISPSMVSLRCVLKLLNAVLMPGRVVCSSANQPDLVLSGCGCSPAAIRVIVSTGVLLAMLVHGEPFSRSWRLEPSVPDSS